MYEITPLALLTITLISLTSVFVVIKIAEHTSNFWKFMLICVIFSLLIGKTVSSLI
jgi:hypothetical protein